MSFGVRRPCGRGKIPRVIRRNWSGIEASLVALFLAREQYFTMRVCPL